LAAVFLAADAARQEDRWMTRVFRRRALIAGVVAGALAAAGVLALSEDAPGLFDGLTQGGGLVALGASVAAGIGTLALVARSRFEPARYTAGIAVTAVVAGWGIAQSPTFLPGLTIQEAATEDSTIIVLLVGLAAGALILVPSLVVLFRLVLAGRFDMGVREETSLFRGGRPARGHRPLPLVVPAALGLGGGVMLLVATVSWLQVTGALAMLCAVAVALPALVVRMGAGDGG